MNRIKKAFTLTETIIVVAVIGILMTGLTVYLGGVGGRAKTIEAQGCAISMRGEMNNYVFYALTSKTLRLSDTTISPDYYYIQLTGGSSTDSKNCTINNYTGSDWTYCDEIVFGYKTGTDLIGNDDNPIEYKTYNQRNTCRQNQSKIGFYWSGDVKYIRMNKGFTPKSIAEKKVFFLQGTGTTESDKLLNGDIIIVLCTNDNCSSGKEVAKRNIDARTQTISTQKCAFYNDDDLIKCARRED